MTRSKSALICVLIVALGSAAAVHGVEPELPGSPAAAPSSQHPFGFRGDGSGRFPGATPTPTWSIEKNVRWSAVVGSSYSSPILAGEFVIVASEPDLLMALDRADGKERWRLKTTPADVTDEAGRKAAEGYEPPKNGSGSTAATPVTDGKTIYVVFANGIVRAVGMNGKPHWTVCINAPPSTGYGRAASPILADGKLIVHITHLFALDPHTGKQLWVNTTAKSTYATPAVMKVGADVMIVAPGGDVVRAADGKTVASALGMTQQATPIVGPDGVIYFPGAAISAVRLGPDYKDDEVWSGAVTGEMFGSPLLVGDTLFIVSGEGQLFAFDAKGKGSIDPLIDGRALVAGPPGKPCVYSSLTLAGKYLFLSSNQGETVVLEATREARRVAINHLAAGGGASPVFSGKSMFVRDGDKLLCIGE